jgi:orotidine-5'-phosphate decarboxylase
MTNSIINNPLVVALDVDSADQAISLVERLSGIAGMFKVGKQLFTAAGPDVVRKIIARGERVFLDLKFHDIPNTVAKAGVQAVHLGVSVFNLHALGGSIMMRTTVESVREAAEREKITPPLILGVTVLTSHSQDTLNEVGIARFIDEEVVGLAQLCEAAGLDGVVASPQEIVQIRRAVTRPNFVILTPGVRPRGAAAHDQNRIMTPAEAIGVGANFIVIGRPITEATDPVEAAYLILSEIDQRINRPN